MALSGASQDLTRKQPRKWRITTTYSVLVILSVTWGLAFVFIKQALLELSPVNLALLRWFMASACFLLLVPLIGRPKTRFERKDVPRLIVMAFANVVGYHISLYYGETSVSAGLAGLLMTFGPVLITILSAALLGERIRSRVVLALGLAVMGALVLSLDTINLGDLASALGPAEIVLTAGFYAVYAVVGKPLVEKYGAPSTAIWSGVLGTAMMLPLLSPSFVSQVGSLSLYDWAAVAYLAIPSTVLGYLLFFTLASRGAVSRLSIQLYLMPVISVVAGVLILGEAVTLATVAGGALMLAAVAVVTRSGKG